MAKLTSEERTQYAKIYRHTLDVLFPDKDTLIEIRAHYDKTPFSGYYKDREKLINDALDRDHFTWYVVLNDINDALYARKQHEHIESGKLQCTGDGDITHCRWLMIDIDPEIPSGISSTDEEKNNAMQKVCAITSALMSEESFDVPPLCCDSGNGYHMLFPVDMSPEEMQTIGKRFAQALDKVFTDEHAKVDIQTAKPSCMGKLYGTMTRKGDSTADRPHRRASMPMSEKAPAKTISTSLFRDYADKILGKEEQKAERKPERMTQQPMTSLDIDAFISKYGIETFGKEKEKDGKRHIFLRYCPFHGENDDKTHTCIIQKSNGELGYKCVKCPGKTWVDFRAYYDADYADYQNGIRRPKQPQKPATAEKANSIEMKAPAETPKNATETSTAEQERISSRDKLDAYMEQIENGAIGKPYATGYKSLDAILNGGVRAGLTMIGAISSLGKTTYLLQMADYMAQAGHDVLFLSLEMPEYELIAKSISRFSAVMADRIGCDRTKGALTTADITTKVLRDKWNDEQKTTYDMATDEYKRTVTRLYIEQSDGTTVDDIAKAIEDHKEKTGKTPIVFIDYLQIIQAPANKTVTDTQLVNLDVTALKRLARKHNTPIICVSAFNRKSYTDPVNLSSFRDSSAIEYGADVLIGMQYDGMDIKLVQKYDKNGKQFTAPEDSDTRDARVSQIIEYYEKQAKKGKAVRVQVKILKQRNGSKDSYTTDFTPAYNIYDVDSEKQKDEKADKKSESISNIMQELRADDMLPF